MRYAFSQVDVFSDRAFGGNPVAVVHDAVGLTDDDLARFARWTNLSETTFLLPPTDPDADYRLRIFTPGGELPFAGHPTLGSARAWLAAGGRPASAGRIVQECGIGLVVLREDDEGRLAFAAPPLQRSGTPDEGTLAAAVRALRVPAEAVVAASWVDNGPGWLGIQLTSADLVAGLRPDFTAMAAADLRLGVCALHDPGTDADLEVRAFVPSLAVPEDPVTGSLNAGLARWLIGAGTLPSSYVASQGAALGRTGRVLVNTDPDDPAVVWIGGATSVRITGTLHTASN